MSENKFSNAGKEFQRQQARDFSTRDQALARLIDICGKTQQGITEFYTAAGLGRPDVYVDMPSEQHVRICYGFRPGRGANSIVRGPLASVFVTPDGKTLLILDVRWDHPDAHNTEPLTGVPLENDDWEETFSDWLANFMTESERLHRNLCY